MGPKSLWAWWWTVRRNDLWIFPIHRHPEHLLCHGRSHHTCSFLWFSSLFFVTCHYDKSHINQSQGSSLTSWLPPDEKCCRHNWQKRDQRLCRGPHHPPCGHCSPRHRPFIVITGLVTVITCRLSQPSPSSSSFSLLTLSNWFSFSSLRPHRHYRPDIHHRHQCRIFPHSRHHYSLSHHWHPLPVWFPSVLVSFWMVTQCGNTSYVSAFSSFFLSFFIFFKSKQINHCDSFPFCLQGCRGRRWIYHPSAT